MKGLPVTFSAQFDAEVVDGILMHRAVDAFTDRHPAFQRARLLLALERRRFAGVLVDVFYDHFLSLQWERWMGNTPRRGFIDRFYRDLQGFGQIEEVDDMPEIATRMAEQDWLGGYVALDGVALTIARIASRSVRFAPMIGGADDLEKSFVEFQSCFEEFFPDAQRFAQEWKDGRSLKLG